MMNLRTVDILSKIDVKIKRRDIEACHRLPPTNRNPNKKVIVRFVNRKNSERSLLSKKKLANINMTELNYPDSTKLYISENLNAHFRKLGWHCRSLKREGLIQKFKYQNEAFFINLNQGNNEKLKITHEDDLEELFPDFFDEF